MFLIGWFLIINQIPIGYFYNMKRKFHSSSRLLKHLWIRDEVKIGERRTPITPEDAHILKKKGFDITVEKSTCRTFSDEEYQKVGCNLAKSQSWVNAPLDAIIVGLKELPLPSERPGVTFEIKHKHILFAHCYKNQNGWKNNLSRYVLGKGELLDLEFLTYDDGKRVAAFGKEAGFAGMAIGVLVWAFQQQNGFKKVFPSVKPYNFKSELIQDMKDEIQKVGKFPSAFIIGSNGRSGTGAVECLKSVGITDFVGWNSKDTKTPGPYLEITEKDIFCNSIYLNSALPRNIFIDKETIEKSSKLGKRKMSVLVDVSCDVSNPKNPVPISDDCTTFNEPVKRLELSDYPLDIIAIDHLPTLIPRESSSEFSKLLLPHIETLYNYNFNGNNESTENVRVWDRVRSLYLKKKDEL